MRHSPLPWHVSAEPETGWRIADARGATVGFTAAEADARFIVDGAAMLRDLVVAWDDPVVTTLVVAERARMLIGGA